MTHGMPAGTGKRSHEGHIIIHTIAWELNAMTPLAGQASVQVGLRSCSCHRPGIQEQQEWASARRATLQWRALQADSQAVSAASLLAADSQWTTTLHVWKISLAERAYVL